MKSRIAVLPGDGIGPEVTAEGVRLLEAVGRRYGHTFHFQEAPVGGIAIDTHGVALPPESLRVAQDSDAVLFGAVGGPKWDDPRAKVRPEDAILGIRKELDLFANLRPVQVFPELIDASPLKPSVLKGVDFVVVRELTGGLYFGKPKRRWETGTGRRRGVDTMAYTEEQIVRVLRVGFELALGRRKKLTSVDKANVLESSRLWRELAVEVASEYPDVDLEHLLVDTVAHAARPNAGALRRPRHREHLWRHPHGRGRGDCGLHGHAGVGQPGRDSRRRGSGHLASTSPFTARRPTSRGRGSPTPWR